MLPELKLERNINGKSQKAFEWQEEICRSRKQQFQLKATPNELMNLLELFGCFPHRCTTWSDEICIHIYMRAKSVYQQSQMSWHVAAEQAIAIKEAISLDEKTSATTYRLKLKNDFFLLMAFDVTKRLPAKQTIRLWSDLIGFFIGILWWLNFCYIGKTWKGDFILNYKFYGSCILFVHRKNDFSPRSWHSFASVGSYADFCKVIH